MKKNLKAFKARALARPDVRKEYRRLAGEFAPLNEKQLRVRFDETPVTSVQPVTSRRSGARH